MTPKLYCADMSPPTRSVYMTAAAIGLHLERNYLNLMAGEHLADSFLKINPFHTVPTLVDGDFTIWDSHAINAYLVGAYAEDDSLYPKDLKQRAVVDQRLHFDSSVLFPRGSAIIGPIIRQGARSVPKDKKDAVVEAYGMLELLLTSSDYLAGDQMTIADIIICCSISTIILLVPIAENRFERTVAWLSKMKALPYFGTANDTGLAQFSGFLKSKLG